MVMRRPVVVAMSGISLVVVGASLAASRTPATAGRAAASVATIVDDSATTPTPTATTPGPTAKAAATKAATRAPVPTATTPTHRATARATTAPKATPKATAAPSVTVNGAAYDTRYGPVQVQITVRSGRIVRADAIDYPQSGGRDQEINSYAIPQLDQETTKAQSAQIDTVSGATYTSDGYRQSLQSAIDAAHKAGAL